MSLAAYFAVKVPGQVYLKTADEWHILRDMKRTVAGVFIFDAMQFNSVSGQDLLCDQ